MANNFQNNNDEKKDSSSGAAATADRLVTRALNALQKEYVLVGKTHVRAWHAWLGIGMLAGLLVGVVLVANRSGEFQPTEAFTLSAPTNLTASAVSPSQINLSWNDTNTRESGYAVERSLSATNGFAEIVRTGRNAISYSDTNLSPGTAYYYRVRAFRRSILSAYSNVASAITLASSDVTPSVISSVAASGITSSSATLSWLTNEPADSQVEYGLATAYGSLSALNATLVTSHSVTLSSLNAGTLYHYRVKSKDAAGNLAVSADATFTTGVLIGGNTYYVATTGNDSVSCATATNITTPKQTINSGLNCMQAGDTMYVRAGTYAEELSTYNGNIHGGTSWSNAVIVSAYPGETVIIKPNIGANRVMTLASAKASFMVFNGFVMDASYVTYDAVKITWSGSVATDTQAYSHHIRIQNSEIKNSPGNGILTTGIYANYNEFINLNVHDNGTTDFDHGFYVSTSNNLIEKSRVYRNAGWGIHVYNGHTGETADNNIVRNNQSYNNARVGNRGVGIGLYSGTGNVAYNNLVWGNNLGIAVNYGAMNSLVYNNTAYANNSGSTTNLEGIDIGSGAMGSVVQNNIAYQNNGGGIVNAGSGTVMDHNLINIDPKFMNAAGADFHLQSSSPAIDAGISTAPTVIIDFDGIARPQGSAYDIGAYEYVDTAPPSVSVTSPASGATVSGTITVAASASDNVAVAGVQFKLDGANLGAEDTASPYAVLWNTATATNASHAITAVARDAAGNMTTSSAISVIVNNSVTDFYVAPGGSDTNSGSVASPWATITHAGSIVGPGATVHVASGTYQEAVTTQVSGTASARVRYVSDTKWGAKIAPVGAYTAWQNNGSYINIEGFEVVGDSATNLGINNSGSFVKIIGNHVHDVPVTLGCSNSNGGAGIDDSNYSASDNDIIGNLVHDIGPFPANGLPVTSYCNLAHGVYHSNLRGHVENNIAYRNAAWGIHLWHAANNVVVSNNLSFNNGATTDLGNTLGGGIVVGAGDSPGGITLDNTTVSNNIVRNNRGMSIREYGNTGSGNRFLNNIAFGNGYNPIWTLTGTQTGTIITDPLMINFQANGGGDYHSQAGSPAIDAGTTMCAPNTSVCVPATDFDGKIRPIGAGYDIGSYEY